MLRALFVLCIFLFEPNNAIADDIDETTLYSKFFQNDYAVKDDRFILVGYNKQFLREMSVVTFKYNRTTNAINVTIHPLVDLTEDNWMVIAQVYKRYGNEYKTFPVHMKFNMCQTFKNNIMGMATYPCGSMSCPALKNVYQHGCNWMPDYSRLPPLVPDGQYMVRNNSTYNGQYLFSLEYMFTIYRKIKIH